MFRLQCKQQQNISKVATICHSQPQTSVPHHFQKVRENTEWLPKKTYTTEINIKVVWKLRVHIRKYITYKIM